MPEIQAAADEESPELGILLLLIQKFLKTQPRKP
jgi:hypothetical protein